MTLFVPQQGTFSEMTSVSF